MSSTAATPLPMPLRRTRVVTFVEPLPHKTTRRSRKARAEASPSQLRIVLDTKSGKRRASRSPRTVRKMSRHHSSHAPCMVRVHTRFYDPAAKTFVWQAIVQRGSHKFLENVAERRAQAMILAQTRRGLAQPEFEIARMGPRMSLGGVPQPGEERRYVFWKGFDKPSLMLEKDLPAPLLA